MTVVVYYLPIVPPLAACYKNAKFRGRVKSKRYIDWQEDAAKHILPPDEPLKACHVSIMLPYISNGDLDNRFKGTLDLLKKEEVIVDDNMSCVRQIVAAWDGEISRKQYIVKITEVKDGNLPSSAASRRRSKQPGPS